MLVPVATSRVQTAGRPNIYIQFLERTEIPSVGWTNKNNIRGKIVVITIITERASMCAVYVDLKAILICSRAWYNYTGMGKCLYHTQTGTAYISLLENWEICNNNFLVYRIYFSFGVAFPSIERRQTLLCVHLF